MCAEKVAFGWTVDEVTCARGSCLRSSRLRAEGGHLGVRGREQVAPRKHCLKRRAVKETSRMARGTLPARGRCLFRPICGRGRRRTGAARPGPRRRGTSSILQPTREGVAELPTEPQAEGVSRVPCATRTDRTPGRATDTPALRLIRPPPMGGARHGQRWVAAHAFRDVTAVDDTIDGITSSTPTILGPEGLGVAGGTDGGVAETDPRCASGVPGGGSGVVETVRASPRLCGAARPKR